MTKILLLLFEDMPMLHISMQNWIQLRSLLILDLSLNLVSIFEPLLNGGLLQASSIFSDYLCFSVFWSNLKQREHIFPPPGVFDFQFSDNICYLALQRPYLNLQVCIVIHFILMFEWHYSAAFFFFFNQSGYSSNCSFFTIILSFLSEFWTTCPTTWLKDFLSQEHMA